MSSFTRLGAALWSWEPWVALGPVTHGPMAQVLWMALYTSPEAKRAVPGLFHGSVGTMAEASRMQPDDTWTALNVLLDREMVEFDQRARVLRMCAPEPHTPLPDAGEFPMNGKTICGWWNRFKTIPDCQVRNAHVATLWWIVETGARAASSETRKTLGMGDGKPTPSHMAAWEKEFARVPTPPKRRRGVRQLGDTDSATSVQPSLFGRREISDQGSDTVSIPYREPSLLPPEPSSSSFRDLQPGSMIPATLIPYRNQQGTGTGEGRSFFSSSGDLRSTADANSRADGPSRPALALVPHPLVYTAQDMFEAIGRYPRHVLDSVEGLREAVERVVSQLVGMGVGLPEIALAGRGIALDENGNPCGIPSPWWLCRSENVLIALERAKRHEQERQARSDLAAEARRTLGYA